jgi:aryl-alcohol dehydrogenase-like predicted oxidoreductase
VLSVTTIAGTDLFVSRWCLGGNVFGWTADERTSFDVLDAYVDAGGTFIDTADVYSQWAHGNDGGESESIIGRWLARRGGRDDLVIASKVGKRRGLERLDAGTIRSAVHESLRRLGVDQIDLYYAHIDDTTVPLVDTLAAFDELVREGLVRYIAASNIEAARLDEALQISEHEGLARYVAVQPEYNLVARAEFEGPLQDLCLRRRLAAVTYYGLAEGFLTGKYRPGGPPVDSQRAQDAAGYLDARGVRVLDALEQVASGRAVSMAAVALAWVLAQPGVTSTIASARTREQVASLAPSLLLRLSGAELAVLDEASPPASRSTT